MNEKPPPRQYLTYQLRRSLPVPRRAKRKWGERGDSNPQPPDPQSGALPLSYVHHRYPTEFDRAALPYSGFFHQPGTPGRTRTCDPLLRRQPLYPTELREHTTPIIPYRRASTKPARSIKDVASGLSGACSRKDAKRQQKQKYVRHHNAGRTC